MLSSSRKFVEAINGRSVLFAGVRVLSATAGTSLRKNAASILASLSLRSGDTLVQNCGDSDTGRIIIQLAKGRELQTLTIIDDKPGNSDTIEELKDLGADIVVPESYTKTWYMRRLVDELRPCAGLNFSDGYQATAVFRAVSSGGVFVTIGRELPKYVAYDGGARRAVEWSDFLKQRNLKTLNF